MKKIAILLTVVLIAGTLSAQDSKSHRPMSKWGYNYFVKRMEKPDNDKRRMKKGVRILKRKYISSNQLYKVSLLFSDDEMRLGFVKEVYPRITDKSNAIVVCDAFDRFSHQTILWDYIQAQNVYYGVNESDMASFQDYLDLRDGKKDRQRDKDKDNEPESDNTEDKTEVIAENNTQEENNIEEVVEEDKTTETNEDTEDVDTPEVPSTGLVFPDPTIYTGINKGCDGYLNDKQFLAFANSVAQFEDDEEKAKICMEYVYTYCFTTEQVMKLGVIMKGEKYRYVFFKTAYEKVYDKDNFLHVKQLLETPTFINGINEIYEVPGTDKPHGVPEEVESKSTCSVSDSDYSSIKSEIRKEYSSTTRAEVAKRLIKEYKCLSSEQIKGLLSLFSLEEDKLDVAKFAYEYVLDRRNYGIVSGYFTSQASKNAITEYINTY